MKTNFGLLEEMFGKIWRKNFPPLTSELPTEMLPRTDFSVYLPNQGRNENSEFHPFSELRKQINFLERTTYA